jgi:hypothetical protein
MGREHVVLAPQIARLAGDRTAFARQRRALRG